MRPEQDGKLQLEIIGRWVIPDSVVYIENSPFLAKIVTEFPRVLC